MLLSLNFDGNECAIRLSVIAALPEQVKDTTVVPMVSHCRGTVENAIAVSIVFGIFLY